MMKQITYLSICFWLIACASPKKHFSDGNYKKAYTSALKDLKGGKKDRSLKSILNNSLDHMIDDNHNETQSLLRSDLIEDWEEAYDITDDLLNLYDEGRRYTDSKYESIILSMRQNNNILKDDIISSYVEMGDMNMEIYTERGDKRAAQEAFYMYQEALKYDHPMGMSDIGDKAEYALSAGTVLVDVIIDAWDIKYNWDIEREFKELEDNDKMFFEVSFDNWSQETDCRLEIDFARLDKDIREQRRTDTYREDIEDGYRNEVDTSGNTIRVPIYKEVRADVTTIEESISYIWDIRVRTDNGSGYCNFRDNQFRVAREITITNYETSGDSRAIPNSINNSNSQTFNNSDERNIIEDLIEESYEVIERYYF